MYGIANLLYFQFSAYNEVFLQKNRKTLHISIIIQCSLNLHSSPQQYNLFNTKWHHGRTTNQEAMDQIVLTMI